MVKVARKAFTSIAVKNQLLNYFKTMGHNKPCLLCCMDGGNTPLYYGNLKLVAQAKQLNISKVVWQTVVV